MMQSLKLKWDKLVRARRMVREAAARIDQARPRRPGPACLVVNTAQMGDVVLSAGVAAELRERHPDSPLLFACQSRWRDIVEGDPAFDGLLHPDSLYSVRAIARAGLFKHVYVLDIPMPMLLNYFQGVPGVFRYAPPTTGDWPTLGKNLMALYEQNAGLPEGAARPRIWVRPEDRVAVADLWRREGLDSGSPVFALHAQSAIDSKTWPPDRFAALVAHWHASHGVRFVVVGGPGEAADLRTLPGVTHVAGQLSLKQTAAAIEACDFFLGLDSGLAYIAEAMGTPGLILLGTTVAETSGPRSPEFSYLRAPGACDPACHNFCSRRPFCITYLSTEAVDAALRAAWERSRSHREERRGASEAACTSL